MLRLAHFPLHHVQYMFFVSTILRLRDANVQCLTDFTVPCVDTDTHSPKSVYLPTTL